LKVFSARLPSWELAGQDIDDKYRDTILKIPGVNRFLRCELQDLPAPYDVISMVHVFEHILDPPNVLRTLRGKLRDGGILVISIPCFLDNPFDLAVVDHSFHFSPNPLRFLLERAGFKVLANDVSWIPKEIVCIAKKSVARTSTCENTDALGPVQQRVSWLRRVLRDAVSWSTKGPVALFGSSIAASWVFGGIAENVVHFVDEDERRLGRTWLDRPIVHPRDARTYPILMPLPPIQAQHVQRKLEQQYPDLRIIPLGQG
jgi:SAM-dependent methyltransferase